MLVNSTACSIVPLFQAVYVCTCLLGGEPHAQFSQDPRNATHISSYFPFPLPVQLSVSPTRACTELSVLLSEHRLHLRCSRHSVLLCNCCLSPSFLPSPNLKHPTSLCSSQLWGICLIHLCIPSPSEAWENIGSYVQCWLNDSLLKVL